MSNYNLVTAIGLSAAATVAAVSAISYFSSIRYLHPSVPRRSGYELHMQNPIKAASPLEYIANSQPKQKA